jgi:hypothetical protein
MFARYSSIAACGSGGGGSKWNVDGGDGECSRNWWSGRDEQGQPGGFTAARAEMDGATAESFKLSVSKKSTRNILDMFSSLPHKISNINL